jgi:hypothetical protein
VWVGGLEPNKTIAKQCEPLFIYIFIYIVHITH